MLTYLTMTLFFFRSRPLFLPFHLKTIFLDPQFIVDAFASTSTPHRYVSRESFLYHLHIWI
jgi:hypothetical protein